MSNSTPRNTRRKQKTVVLTEPNTCSSSSIYVNDTVIENNNKHGNLILDNHNHIDLCDELKKLSYTPIDKYYSEEGNGEKTALFIKAKTPCGEPVFIEMNTLGNVPITHKDRNILEVNTTFKEFENDARKNLKVHDFDVYGVALECQNGLCVIGRNTNDLSYFEKNFTFAQKNASASVIHDQEVYAYPILRYSDLHVNPTIALGTIDKALKKMRNAEHIRVQNQINQNVASVQHLTIALNNFVQLYSQAGNLLANNLSTLESYANCYLDLPQLNPEQIAKYKLLLFNLGHRHDLAEKLINIGRKVGIHAPLYENEAQELECYNQILSQIINHSDKIIEPSHSDNCQ